jgi:hypothetical protein
MTQTRRETLIVILALILLSLSVPAFSQSVDTFVGTWKLDRTRTSNTSKGVTLVVSKDNDERTLDGIKYKLNGARISYLEDNGPYWTKGDTKLTWNGAKLVLAHRSPAGLEKGRAGSSKP